jgi:hypothetical protein
MPAWLNIFTAARRFRVDGARGSRVLEISGVREVTEIATETRSSFAMSESRSMSRDTLSDFVVM